MHFLPLVLASILAAAQSPERRLDVETYDLGLVDVHAAAEAVRPLLSPAGRVVEDERNHRIIVVDVPEVHRAVRAALRRVEVSARNIRLAVTLHWKSTSDRAGVRLRPRGDVVSVEGDATQSRSTTTARQELLVLSGGRASLRIADEVPYADWFWTWGLGRGLWVQGVRWRDVASGMDVEPVALPEAASASGSRPYFEYFVDAGAGDAGAHAQHRGGGEGGRGDASAASPPGREFRERFLIGFDRAGTSRRRSRCAPPWSERTRR